MQLTTHTLTALLLFFSSAQYALALPQSHDSISADLVERAPTAEEIFADGNALVKRKGGGGGGGKGGGGGSSSGGTGASGSSSSGYVDSSDSSSPSGWSVRVPMAVGSGD